MQLTPEQVLKKYWNYKSFRPRQKEIIDCVLNGQDTLAILPTGGGKSLCYQIPALVLGGITLVVSPLIALMQDQVGLLRKRGISAAFIHSGLFSGEINDILARASKGEFSLLYVSPERLQSPLFLNWVSTLNIKLLAIDEAHCISQWGHDFRPSYLKIKELKEFISKDVIWIALTATATPKVETEILNYSGLRNPKVFKQSVFRQNLDYQVVYTEDKAHAVVDLLTKHKGTGILYCPTRRKCMEMREWLKANGIKSLAYHAGMNRGERERIQDLWTQSDDFVVCATNAFGMGIDKPNVKIVIHWTAPDSLEAYYQEAGRAGRNGQEAYCVLLKGAQDAEELALKPKMNFPPRKQVAQIYQFLCDFLQIPVGSGAESIFPFDFNRFIKNFKLQAFPTLSALHILEQEGYFVWEKEGRLSSMVQVLGSESDIAHLQNIVPDLFEILNTILRLHEGVFNFPTKLKIWDVADYLNKEQGYIKQGLQKLDKLHLLRYQPGNDGSLISFLMPRVSIKQLDFDVKRIRLLKQSLSERIKQMIQYLEDNYTCRNRIIAEYFGEKLNEDCRHCDNCNRKYQTAISNQNIYETIKEILIQDGKSTLQELPSHLPAISNQKIIEQVRRLQEEDFCRVSPNGTIELL